MKLPREIPAMSLRGAVLLPKTLMPLRIFEEKYREMLSDSLVENRMFAIANQISLSDEDNPENIHNVATIGLIRMSSQNRDGTSLLMLEGTDRVKIEAISQMEPYPRLRISPLPTQNRPSEDIESELFSMLLTRVDELSELLGDENEDAARACHVIDDLEMLCHFIMQTYCSSATLLQNTLEATDLVVRCGIVSDYLELQIMLIKDANE